MLYGLNCGYIDVKIRNLQQIVSIFELYVVNRKKIYVMGWSTGAYLAMIAAHNNRLVKGCILFDFQVPTVLLRLRHILLQLP